MLIYAELFVQDDSVDPIPDADESMSAGSASTSSHILDDDDGIFYDFVTTISFLVICLCRHVRYLLAHSQCNFLFAVMLDGHEHGHVPPFSNCLGTWETVITFLVIVHQFVCSHFT